MVTFPRNRVVLSYLPLVDNPKRTTTFAADAVPPLKTETFAVTALPTLGLFGTTVEKLAPNHWSASTKAGLSVMA